MESIINKNRINKLTASLIVFSLIMVSVLAMFVSLQSAHAATGSMYLNPSTKTVINGEIFVVDVRANAASANATQIDISYPSDKLDLINYTLNTAVMTDEAAPPKTSAGNFSYVTYAMAGSPGVSGDSLLLSFAFRAKVGSGAGVITLLPSSKVVDAGVQVTTTYGSSNITFTTPVTPQPPAPYIVSFTTTPNPAIVQVGGTVKLSWTANNSVGCTVAPGGPTNTTANTWTTPVLNTVGNKSYTLTCRNSNNVLSTPRSAVVMVSAVPISAQTIAATPTPIVNNTSSATYNKTPTPTPAVKGAVAYTPPIALNTGINPNSGMVDTTILIIKDGSGKPIANAEVTFAGTNNKVFKTDKNGKVIINKVPSGKLSMTVKSDGKVIAKQDVTLVAGVTDYPQQISIKNAATVNKTLIATVAAILVAILLVGAAIILLLKKRNHNYKPTSALATPVTTDTLDTASTTSAKVIVGNEKGPKDSPTIITPEINTEDTISKDEPNK